MAKIQTLTSLLQLGRAKKAEDAQPSCAVALDAEACIVTQRCGPGCGMWALFAAWRLSRPAANQNPMQV